MEGVVDIGARIRALRTERGMSQRELARLGHCSVSHLRQIEEGKASPNLAALVRMAAALDIDPGQLLTLEACPEVTIVRGNTAGVPGDPCAVTSLTGHIQGGFLAAESLALGPHAKGPQRRTREEEGGIVLAGRVVAEVGTETHELATGDGFFLPRARTFRLSNPAAEPAILFWVRREARTSEE
jgi:DNA-binding XRE family transcriptional regulator